ncbi:hypothetical protein C4886_06290 [Blautia obeum]|uniref:Uncharacterized protein n=1 Tax=Blautia obeum TaxID=40520 RepID=A0A367G415_9FIRM|nr:hypothetical protein C4886_06290 [Blautia obeum]
MVLGEFLGVWAWGLFFCGMNGGRDERTGCRPAGSLSVLFFGGVRCGGGPSALRWMAAGAEFPCDVPGGGGASALRWMWVG